MRRLATQSRDDNYKSARDYQEVFEEITKSINVIGPGPHKLTLSNLIQKKTSTLQAWGGYLAASHPVTLRVDVIDDRGLKKTSYLELGNSWMRVGDLITDIHGLVLKITLSWQHEIKIDFWGFTSGCPLSSIDGEAHQDASQTASYHIIPETFYLHHITAIDMDIESTESTHFNLSDGRTIHLKKCSYCGRQLPIDPNNLGVLAFHKHNKKKSLHQNECRACKKWRINDNLNHTRTPDQLHESSVITRERKIFLREPERLQEIKERTGAGLRSQVWERFEKKCFRCATPVALDGFHLDHTRPLAYLWPIDEFATCLCSVCNNEKKDKFPVDFYTSAQIRRLSEITGLSEVALNKKSINESELIRMTSDLPRFARGWEPRTFFAIARKVIELKPEVSLIEIMQKQDITLYQYLETEYLQRPMDNDSE
ncbi:HNH endonuclease [Pseudomonas hamedanensis]|uniref:Uncharacterized protein n=1 Tax=Pseudomonas hamedanensis TaxID=2745504 RepID=A0A9E6NV09_9PSED|nr:hypothetical protein [Pseudomonas hamedanensis]QXI15024.1 hypothetical protein HU739_013900 [Pseudomonas hamedanensis]